MKPRAGGAGKRRRGEPKPLGDVLRRVMRGRLSRKGGKEGALQEVWEEAVGPVLAGRLAPLRLRAGVLWVAVESPALLYEVAQFKREEIRDRLRALCPQAGVEDVRFRLV